MKLVSKYLIYVINIIVFLNIVKLITDDFKGDKNDFINHIKGTIYPVTETKVQERATLEKNVLSAQAQGG
jgi:hypothetical protein